MKVYIVKESHGQYDDYHENIIGVFDSKEVAEELKTKYEIEKKVRYESIKDEYEALDKRIQSEYSDSDEDVPEWNKIYDRYWELEGIRYEYEDFNSCRIEEFELNDTSRLD